MSEATKSVVYLTTGLILGGAAGYFVTKKILDDKYEAQLQQEIKEVKDYYKLVRKEDEYSSPESVATNSGYEQIIETYEYSADAPDILHAEVIEIEDEQDDNPIEERNGNEPYVISVDEFMTDKDTYDKNTITYFDGDDILCDETEQVIPNIKDTVGAESLTKFGHKSNDKRVVYVRNDQIQMDFEILLDDRSYSEVVLGIKEDKRVGKMREDD